MTEAAGEVPDEADKTGEAGDTEESGKADNTQSDHVRIEELSTKISRRLVPVPSRLDYDGVQEIVEVDRMALEAILDVSSRIQTMQKKSRPSMSTLALAHESYKDKQAKAKEARNNRMGGIKTQHRFLLENAAAILNKTPEYVLEGVYDADIHIELLDSVVAEGGRNCIVLCDALLPPLKMDTSIVKFLFAPLMGTLMGQLGIYLNYTQHHFLPTGAKEVLSYLKVKGLVINYIDYFHLESGRFIHMQKGLMDRTYISDGGTIGTVGKCVAMYRIKNKAVDMKSVADDFFLVLFDMNRETGNVVSGIYKTMNSVYVPALQMCKAWGDLNPPNPNSEDIIKSYVSKIMLFIDYLASK